MRSAGLAPADVGAVTHPWPVSDEPGATLADRMPHTNQAAGDGLIDSPPEIER